MEYKRNERDELLFSVMCIVIWLMIITCLTIGFYILDVDDCCQCGASNGCCPCPNYEYIEQVESHCGYDASGAGSWKEMCDEYKKDMNETFDCFQ